MNKRIARTAKSKMNGDDAPVEGGLQSLFVEGKNFIHYNPNDYQHTKQKSIRSRINGILALTSLEKLLVPNIYDISLGGLSFLHANEKDVSNSLFKMDIVIFDIQTDFEYLITGVKGWVNSKELSLEPVIECRFWQFHIEFFDLDGLQESLLQSLCDLLKNHSKH